MTTTITRSRLAALLAVLTLSLAACGGGSSSSSEPAGGGGAAGGETAGADAESMTLDEFAAELARQTQQELCGAPDAPLRQCFEVDEPTCVRAFTVAMTECANQLRAELPAQVDASSADATAGPISQCAGQAYRLGLDQNGLVRQTPECTGG